MSGYGRELVLYAGLVTFQDTSLLNSEELLLRRFCKSSLLTYVCRHMLGMIEYQLFTLLLWDFGGVLALTHPTRLCFCFEGMVLVVDVR